MSLHHLVYADVQGLHRGKEVGKLLVEELIAANGPDDVACSLAHEEAQTTSLEDDLLLAQPVEGAYHRVHIHLHLHGIVTHRGKAFTLGTIAREYLIADDVCYLQVYRFVVFEVHRPHPRLSQRRGAPLLREGKSESYFSIFIRYLEREDSFYVTSFHTTTHHSLW